MNRLNSTPAEAELHLCVEGRADPGPAPLSVGAFGGLQVSAEARQWDGGPTVRQEHVS